MTTIFSATDLDIIEIDDKLHVHVKNEELSRKLEEYFDQHGALPIVAGPVLGPGCSLPPVLREGCPPLQPYLCGCRLEKRLIEITS